MIFKASLTFINEMFPQTLIIWTPNNSISIFDFLALEQVKMHGQRLNIFSKFLASEPSQIFLKKLEIYPRVFEFHSNDMSTMNDSVEDYLKMRTISWKQKSYQLRAKNINWRNWYVLYYCQLIYCKGILVPKPTILVKF